MRNGIYIYRERQRQAERDLYLSTYLSVYHPSRIRERGEPENFNKILAVVSSGSWIMGDYYFLKLFYIFQTSIDEHVLFL